jgi:hypothetical protein
LKTLQENSPYPSVSQVLSLFKDRCPKCRRIANTVHELEPRSRGVTTMRMQNRTAICDPCHEEFHKQGASEHNISVWKEIIFDYLQDAGTWEVYKNWGSDVQIKTIGTIMSKTDKYFKFVGQNIVFLCEQLEKETKMQEDILQGFYMAAMNRAENAENELEKLKNV